jgi:hypothetical protein
MGCENAAMQGSRAKKSIFAEQCPGPDQALTASTQATL